MATQRKDQTVCRYCRQREPQVLIRRIKGLPVGECKACNTKRQLDARRRKRFALGLYSDTPELVASVHKTLAGLTFGAYGLISNISKLQVGYVVVQDGSAYVDTWGQVQRFHFRRFEIASYIGNQGLYIDSKPIEVKDGEGNTLATAAIGLDLPLTNPADALVWFNPVLLEHALSLVRDELKHSKANRSKIPSSKDDTKA